MQISPISSYTQPKTTFQGRGKPIDLKYIVENRSNLLPKRVLDEARKIINRGGELPSLRDLHLRLYAPLLKFETMEQVRENYDEFKNIKDDVVFRRDSVRKKEFEERTKGKCFPLYMLQKLWGELKTKDDVAQELGMASRSSIDWALKQIDFAYYPKNYKTLLKASDEEGQKGLAQKRADWNALHPDLMYKHNKHAAQFCKTPEYREAQSKRIIERDKLHPERKQKISEANRIAWSLCPEVRDALSRFAAGESSYCRGAMKKKTLGERLTASENRSVLGFYKRFWAAHPELRAVFAAAKKGAKGETK